MESEKKRKEKGIKEEAIVIQISINARVIELGEV